MSLRFACLIALLSVSSWSFGSSTQTPDFRVDLTGRWKWTMQRQNGGGREIVMNLKQEGEKLTGTVSGLGFGGETDIQDGTFKDGRVTFKVVRTRGGQDITTTYSGKLSGDTIKGVVDTDMRGNKVPREWEAHRVKDDAAKPQN
jgi:hypothetical protein